MHVTLAGMGCGTAATMTGEVLAAVQEAEYLAGAPRLLQKLHPAVPCGAATKPEEILRLLLESGAENCCVVFSGDTGFYSGAKHLLPLLRDAGIAVRVLPGISSIQYFAARLERSWQDWTLCSAHGTDCDAVYAVMQGKPACFLIGGTGGIGKLCRQLTDAGLGDLPVTVGEDLSCETERITAGTAAEFSSRTFSSLSVLLAEPAPRWGRRVPGLPDELFCRGDVPMTKQMVRAAILAELSPEPEDICWDIGAGTGSVSVELSLCARQVWAVEKSADACSLIRENREKFCAWNLHLVPGEAPEALPELPKPDRVFVGGSGGHLEAILSSVREIAPRAPICVSAVSLETLSCAMETMQSLGYAAEITQLSVSRAKTAGRVHMLLAQNPVFLVTGKTP